jgi:hypothetical protein
MLPLAKKPDAYKSINSSTIVVVKPVVVKQEETNKDELVITNEMLIPWVFIK